jgi:hypothetical protein
MRSKYCSYVADHRYLANIPLMLIVLSLPIILLSYFSSRTSTKPLSTSLLTSPAGDLNLVSLESETIISALAANVLPPPREGKAEEKLGGEEAAEVIVDFTKDEAVSVARWRRVKYAVGVIGALIWLGSAIGAYTAHGDWKRIAFPVCPLTIQLTEDIHNAALDLSPPPAFALDHSTPCTDIINAEKLFPSHKSSSHPRNPACRDRNRILACSNQHTLRRADAWSLVYRYITRRRKSRKL